MSSVSRPELHAKAVLFDLDGVLVDSSRVVHRHWKRWCARHDIPLARVLEVATGRRTIETVRLVAPALDADEEAGWLAAAESVDRDGLARVAGVERLLAGLPAGSWGIVTSGTRATAWTRLDFASIPEPTVLVTAEDVRQGKPDPEGYRIAARRLGFDPGDCVVVEDAPAGVEAARRAGMRCVGVCTTHQARTLAGADLVLPQLASLVCRVEPDGGMRLSRSP